MNAFRAACVLEFPKERLIQLKNEPRAQRRFSFMRALVEEDRAELRQRYLRVAKWYAGDELWDSYLEGVDLKGVDERGIFFSDGETRVPTELSLMKDDGSYEDVNLVAAHTAGQHVYEAMHAFERTQIQRVDAALLPDSTGLTYDRASDTYTINGARITMDALSMARENAPRA